ncbi:MAG: HD domain-containing protein [Chloroflexota bacterium]|nr:HD domain-containing protein [Chloroflexota bacterium]
MSGFDAHLEPATRFRIASVIRDALYDRIPVSEPELALINSTAFARLERIQQLGFVSRVWPSARHTRFEHSLGVMHLTRLAVAHLRATPEGASITDEDARACVAAALLHDVGHYPYSHAIEELGGPILPHEEIGRQIILGPEISPLLADLWGVAPDRVADFIFPGGQPRPRVDEVLTGLLSGALDMDKLDYLPRDARACNVPYGGVDTARLISALTIAPVGASLALPEPRVAIQEKGISPLHSLINARQAMFDNVYWHHTNRACSAMLLRAIQDAMLAGAIAADTLPFQDDRSLLDTLAQPDMPESTQCLASALQSRRVHKRAVEIGSRAVELYGRLGNLYFDPRARRGVEMRMAEGLSAAIGRPVPDAAILIDIPKPEKWKTDVWVSFENPPIGYSDLMPWRDVVGLSDEDFKRYEEHRRLIRIVTQAEFRDDVRNLWERLLYPQLGAAI